MNQESFGAEAKAEHLSEADAEVVTWFQEQGFAVNGENPAGILEAYAALQEEGQASGEDVIASAPRGLEAYLQRLQSGGAESAEAVEGAPLPLEEMAKYLGEKIDGEIDPNDTELMATIYANLKSEVRGASGVFDTNPEVDPLYDLPIKLSDAFEALLKEREDTSYDLAA